MRPRQCKIAASASSPAECPPIASYRRRAMSRPCSGLGPRTIAARTTARSSANPGRSALVRPGRRNMAARPASSIRPVVWMKWSAASIHPGCGTAPVRRNMTQGLRTVAAAALRRIPSASVELVKRQPAMSATSAVASREPASAMTTSANRPAAAAGTSAERVSTKLRSEFCVEMIALNMELSPVNTVATISCGVWQFAATT